MCNTKLALTILAATMIAEGWTNIAAAGPIDNLQPGHWYEVPGSRLDSVDPCPAKNCSYSGNLGVSAVMDAWSGGAFDSRRDRLMVWGGGHNSYAGNELYAFDIQSETWMRLSEPSTNIQTDVARYSDGRPSSRHTYNDLQYDPQRDWFLSLGTSGVFAPNAPDFPTVDAFDLSNNSWLARASRPAVGGYGGGFSAFDPVSGRHFLHLNNGGRLQMYDPSTDRWSTHVETGGVPIYMTADVDSKRENLVAIGAGKIFVYDLKNLNGQPLKNISTGDLTAQNAGQIGFQYDPVSDKFVAWAGGASVYILDPDTWNWTRRSPAAGNTVTPTAVNMNGTYGRFRYVPSKNAFVLVNDVDGNVFYYKLSSGSGSPPGGPIAPTLSFSTAPSNVLVGGSSTLTWSSSGADDCTASGSWSGNVALSGSISTGVLQQSATYTLDCTGAGGSVARSVTVVVSGSGGGSGQAGDWAARSSGPGVIMSTRFDTEADVMNWLAGNTKQYVSWDTSRMASGAGSMRFDVLKTANAATGDWARWLADDQREFTTGDEIYIQFREYIPTYHSTHRFIGGGGWKQAVISRHAASMNGIPQIQPYGSNQLNELTIQNTNHRGVVQGYNRDSDGRYPPWEVGQPTACTPIDITYQNAIDRGVNPLNGISPDGNPWTNCEQDHARFGGMDSFYRNPANQPSGWIPGQPNPITGAFKYYPNEWLTFLVYVRFGQYGGHSNDTRVKVWAAREGMDYTLLIDRTDIDLGNGPNHDTLWLLPYNTGRIPDPNRSDTYVNYDEVIVSTQFISAPLLSAGSPTKEPEPPSLLIAQ